MSEAWVAALSAIITGLMSLIGVYAANRKSSALIMYRLEQLERKQDAHNQLIDRMYRVEGRVDVLETELNDIKKKGA